MFPAIPAVHVLALVAYNQEAISAAIDVAMQDAQSQYGSQTSFSYSLLWNPTRLCDSFESIVVDHVASYFYDGHLRARNASLLILAAGCSQAEYSVAELAREWNIPIVISVGTGTLFRNKRRFPTMACFVPSDFTRHPRVFKALLDWYKWRRISIICDVAASMTDFYSQSLLKAQCRDFAAVIAPSSKGDSTQYYDVYSVSKDLDSASGRRAALLEAKAHIIVIVSFADNLRSTLLKAHRMGMTSSEYVYVSVSTYPFSAFGCSDLHWRRNDSLDGEAEQAFHSLFIVTLARPPRSEKLDNISASIRSTSQSLFNGTGQLTEDDNVFSIATYVTLQVVFQTISERLRTFDPFNGQQLAKSIYNRTFATADGLCEMNPNGDRDNTYTVLGMEHENGDLKELLMFNARRNVMYSSPHNFTWIRHSSVPPDRPFCGFNGEDRRCDKGSYLVFRTGAIISAVLLLFICFSLAAYHYSKREKKNAFQSFCIDQTLYQNTVPVIRLV